MFLRQLFCTYIGRNCYRGAFTGPWFSLDMAWKLVLVQARILFLFYCGLLFFVVFVYSWHIYYHLFTRSFEIPVLSFNCSFACDLWLRSRSFFLLIFVVDFHLFLLDWFARCGAVERGTVNIESWDLRFALLRVAVGGSNRNFKFYFLFFLGGEIALIVFKFWENFCLLFFRFFWEFYFTRWIQYMILYIFITYFWGGTFLME